MKPNDPCPCGSDNAYKNCCRPWHNGRPAPNAEKLMRSRYAAHVIGKADYIMRTSHPNFVAKEDGKVIWRRKLNDLLSRSNYLGLRIMEVEEGTTVSYVTFKVFMTYDNAETTFVERSRFEKVGKKWLYWGAEDQIKNK